MASEIGNFADVHDLGDGTVLKAFLARHSEDRSPEFWSYQDRITRRVFREEAESYERLQNLQDIEPFLPRYFGRVDPIDLGFSAGNRGPYLKDCGILLERLTGKELKVGNLPPPLLLEADALLDRICAVCGRMELADASCFVPGSRRVFTIFDFALWGSYSEVSQLLSKRGALPEGVINMFSLSL